MRNGHGEKSVWRRSSRAHSLRFWGQSNLNSKRNRQFAIHVMAAVPVEEAIAALSTFSLEDEQPEVQGPSVLVSTERGATASPIEYSDVNAYRLSLSEDTKALNQLNTLIQEGKEMASVLYTYRSCVKALPQLPNSMKHSQADLYLETYQVLDLEMSRLREIQRWQASAASKLAADMQRFSRPERRINGPTITHLWSMLKLLDVLVQLDHLKNAKASIPNDFSWYKRTFTQVSVQWQDTDSMREELDDLQIFLSTRWAILLNLHVEMFRVNNVEDILQVLIVFAVESLELDFALLFPERHILLRVLPVLVVLATSSEKDSESLYKRVKINRLINIFKLLLLKSTDNADIEWCKEVKGNMYDMVIEGFQLLSKWTARIWEQCAWKFSRPYKDAVPSETNEASASYSDYEKVVRYNYSAEERKALVELVSYIKNIGSMMLRSDTLVADALWETIHAEVQDFVQNTLATMLRTTFRKKKDLSRILSDMRTLSADWMANNSRPEAEQQSMHHVGEESRGNIFYPRAVAPTAAQVHCLQFLIYEVVSGGNLRKPGGLFGNTGSEIPVNELKQLESFFYKLSFFLHILDYTATVSTLTDLGFLWFREFYLESSRVIQFPIECSLPWMLVDHVLESQNAGLLESVMMPFDIYNDSAQQALVVLKQRFLYDEIEAEVDHCFDIFVSRLCETIFTYYKSWAASELLDPSFLFSSDNGEKYSVQPMRLSALFKMTRVKIWSEMQSDFLPNFILCNTTQRFIRSSKVPLASVQKPSVPYAKPSFYCGTQDLNSAHQSFARLHSGFFGIPHMFSIVRLLGSRSLPWLIRALLDHISNKCHALNVTCGLNHQTRPSLAPNCSKEITTLEPLIMGLQETLPKSIGLLHFDSGVTGCMRLVKEQLNWGTKSELKAEVLHGIKEIGSVLYWMGLLDIVLREVDTTHFMQTAPWLGFLPGADGQISYHQDGGDSPVVNLFKSATAAIVSNPGCPNPTSFHTMSKQAEAADLLYKANMNTGSVLEYALAFTSAALDKYCSKWSATPKTGFIDITTSKDFYRIYSELNLRVGDRYQGYLEESSQTPSNNHKVLGDSVAWGGCTIIYLLGQQLHFELFDFSYQVLNVAEVEAISVPQSQKHPHFGQVFMDLEAHNVKMGGLWPTMSLRYSKGS
ncbi:protein PIR [Citrus sinensis]|uniref:Protein PIR n=1 Tax=Citrus sinensis TaxID=2711 RepID=A0ACB8MEA1_CITSI|nr:protein PIR [Citrus sinensis]